MACPSTYDYHGVIEAAIRSWREADKRLAAMVGAERTDHEAAVRAALPFLRPIDNVKALVRHYTEDRSIDPTNARHGGSVGRRGLPRGPQPPKVTRADGRRSRTLAAFLPALGSDD